MTAIKVAILAIVVATGIAVLTGHTRVNEPGKNLRLEHLWADTRLDGALWTSALFKSELRDLLDKRYRVAYLTLTDVEQPSTVTRAGRTTLSCSERSGTHNERQ